MAVLIVGVVLTLLSCSALGISTSMPIINKGHASWNEAMMGIIPASICSVLSLIVAIVGLVLVLMAPKADGAKEPRRKKPTTTKNSNDN